MNYSQKILRTQCQHKICLKTPQFYSGCWCLQSFYYLKNHQRLYNNECNTVHFVFAKFPLKTADVCQHIWKPLLIILSSSGKAVACTHSKGFISDHTNACNHLCFTLIFIMDCITLLLYYSRMPFEAVVWLSCIKCGPEKASTLQKCNKLDCSLGTYHWGYHNMHAPQAGFSCSESHKGYTVTIIIASLGIGIYQTNACLQMRYLVSIWNSFLVLVSFLLLIQRYFSQILYCFSRARRQQKAISAAICQHNTISILSSIFS